jgi:hypothetical protein
MNHTSLLNFLADKIKAKSYLEIGIQEPRQNFDRINVSYKVGVDPAISPVFNPGPVCKAKTSTHEAGDYLNWYELNNVTSDVFFDKSPKPRRKFSLIFIDGLHHADQVERDFNNSLQCLSDDGYIVIHDCLPVEEITSLVPRQSKCWHGDVYRFIMKLHTYAGINFVTLNMDNGCCVVWKEPGKEPNTKLLAPIDWESYQTFGKAIMKVAEPSVFFESLKLNSVI